MKRASSGSPVQVLTSTMSRHCLTESLTETNWLSVNSGAFEEFDRHSRVVGAPRELRELKRSWMSYRIRRLENSQVQSEVVGQHIPPLRPLSQLV